MLCHPGAQCACRLVRTGHADQAGECAAARHSCYADPGRVAWPLLSRRRRSLAAGSPIASNSTPRAGRNSTTTAPLGRQAAESSAFGAPEG